MDLRSPWALKEPMWNLHRDRGPGLVGPQSRRAARLDGFFTRGVNAGGGLSLVGGVGGGRSCRPAGEPSASTLTRSNRVFPSTLDALTGSIGAARARCWMGTLVGRAAFLGRLGGGVL